MPRRCCALGAAVTFLLAVPLLLASPSHAALVLTGDVSAVLRMANTVDVQGNVNSFQSAVAQAQNPPASTYGGNAAAPSCNGKNPPRDPCTVAIDGPGTPPTFGWSKGEAEHLPGTVEVNVQSDGLVFLLLQAVDDAVIYITSPAFKGLALGPPLAANTCGATAQLDAGGVLTVKVAAAAASGGGSSSCRVSYKLQVPVGALASATV